MKIADFGFACEVKTPKAASGLCGSPGPPPRPPARALRWAATANPSPRGGERGRGCVCVSFLFEG